ncbi:MAG: response regulator [bacterium]|nr:response regulator [bacterium]
MAIDEYLKEEKTRKILVIDDSKLSRAIIKKTLTQLNMQITEAEDGVEGLEALNSDSFDLVLVDIIMPRLDGFGFLDKFKEVVQDDFIPVILMTGSDDLDSKIKSLRSGADDFLRKPLHEKELTARVISLLRLKNAHTELSNTLKEVQELKQQQDGDYFLTSLLLEPLGGNHAISDEVSVDFLIKEKKEFQFRKWKKEIGGDICYSHNITLKGKPYTVFLNADAMGKSMQGAGGALVLGSVFQAITDRTRFVGVDQDQYPELWIKNSHGDLQRVFESFDGSMAMSLVMGLIDHSTGLMYYINAEHPWTILYRNQKATFIENELILRKLGVTIMEGPFRVKTYQLQPGDVIIAGSDGRDDILISQDESQDKLMNEDEMLFLEHVEKGDGSLEQIYQQLNKLGELSDDLSLLRIAYKEGQSSDDNKFLKGNESLLQELKNPKNGNLDNAVHELEQICIIDKSNPVLLKELLKVLINTKDYNKTLLYIEEYIDLRPEETEFIYIASYCFKKAGDLKRAAELAQRIVLRDPEETRYLMHLARIYTEQNKFVKADIILDEVLQVKPDHSKAQSLKDLVTEEIRKAEEKEKNKKNK